MGRVKGWKAVGFMLARPAWLLVAPTAVLVPLILSYVQRGEMAEGAALGWGIGIVLLAMMSDSTEAKRGTTHGARFEYVGMLAIMGGFVGVPTLLLGLPVLWLSGMHYSEHAMAISSAMGGVIAFVGLIIYTYKYGVRHGRRSGGGTSVYFDNGYDGRD